MTERKRLPRREFALPALLGDGLLLLCALWGLLLSFLSLYDIFPAPDALPPLLAATALFALAALTVWSLPRYSLAVSAALELVWLGTALYRWQSLAQGGRLAWNAMLAPFFQRVLLVEPPVLAMELTTAQQQAAVNTFLLMATALLALLIGWAVIRARRWWLVVFLTLPPLLPGLLSDIYPFWPAFAALLTCWLTMLLSALCRWTRSAGRGRLTLIAAPCVAALLAGLMLAAPPADYAARPQWALDAQTALLDWGNRYLARWDSEISLPGISAFVGGADPIDLSSAGPLNYSGRTVLRVTADYSGQTLLRGASMTHYTGTGWDPMTAEEYALYPDSEAADGGALSGSPLLFPADAGEYDVHTVTVQNVGASGGCLYVPYQLAQQDFDSLGLRLEQDAYVARKRGEWTHTLSVCPDALDLQDHSFSLEDGSSQRYSDFVLQTYLEVPDWMEAVMQSPLLPDGEEADGSADYGSLQTQLEYRFSLSRDFFLSSSDLLTNATRLGWANAVTSLLDDLCEYDPDTPAVPEGEDFVAYFLTESRRGYCMHFASAATLMLRELGVPARYVSGFVADLEAGQTVNVPDYAAHAWVEIYLEDYGWYPVDVTPDYVYAPDGADEPEQSQAPDAVPSPSSAPSSAPAPTPAPSHAPAAQPSQPAEQEAPGGAQPLLPRVLPWLALAACAVLLLWLGQYLPKRRRASRLAGPDPNRAVLDCYRWLTRLTRWGGRLDPAAQALAEKARFSRHTLTEDERQVMAALFHRERARLAADLPLWKRLPFLYLWGGGGTV